MAVDQKYYETPGHVIAAAVALSILDIVALFLRFYTRRRKNQGLKIDDWLLVPAVVSHTQEAIGSSVVSMLIRQIGLYGGSWCIYGLRCLARSTCVPEEGSLRLHRVPTRLGHGTAHYNTEGKHTELPILFFTHIVVDPMAFHPAPPIDPGSGQSQLPFLLYADICGEQEEPHKHPAYRTHRFCRPVECGLLFRDLV